MRKIVINTSHSSAVGGGLCLSHQAFSELRSRGQREALQETDLGAYWPIGATPNEPRLNRCGAGIPRDDEQLVQVVEALGPSANGHAAMLKVVAIPQDVEWEIETVAGVEHVSEVHRRWS